MSTRGEVEVDAGQWAGHPIARLWLEPEVSLHPAAAEAIPKFDAAVIGPGSFYTSLIPIFLVRGAPEAIQQVKGPVILVANLLTEGRGMSHFTVGDAVREMSAAIGRDIDVVLINTARGPIVEEKALIEALQIKRLAGAALDVFEQEPLPLESPLLKMDNVMLAPHNSNSSPAAWERVHWNTIRNLFEGLGLDYELEY